MAAEVFGLASPMKALSGLAPCIISVSIQLRITEKLCLLGKKRSNNSNKIRLSFDASTTGGCKPTRIAREGCGSTEFWVCSLEA